MAWNNPGGPGDRNPWRKQEDQGPPDLDELFKKLRERMGKGLGGGSGGGTILLGVFVLILAFWVLSGFYRINEGERGVVLRFGAYQATTLPGLRWHVPYPVERVERVNIGRIREAEVGYRSNARTGQKTVVPRESLMLTEDENIIHVEFAVQYRIVDPGAYLFNVLDPEMTLHQVTESAIREVVGKSKMEFILSEGRGVVTAQVQALVQQLLDGYDTGLQLTRLNMQDAQPPEQVQAAFADAVKAREDKQRLINEAEAYRNEVLPKARGEAARILSDANAYREEVVERAGGEATRFSSVLAEYEKAPEVTRERLYLEALEEVLRRNRKVVIDADQGNNLFYLPLDQMMGSERVGSSGISRPPSSGNSVTGDEARRVRESSRGREPRR